MPDLNTALQALRDDGTLADISQRYLKANATGSASPGPGAQRSTWRLIADNLWPLAKAAITVTIPLTIISFVIGLVIALVVALARCHQPDPQWHCAAVHLDHPRHPCWCSCSSCSSPCPSCTSRSARFPAAVIAFSLNVGGYAAEIIRSAIQSIPKVSGRRPRPSG